SSCDSSLLELLRQHPELPHFNQPDNWRRRRPGSPKLGNKHARTKLTSQPRNVSTSLSLLPLKQLTSSVSNSTSFAGSQLNSIPPPMVINLSPPAKPLT